MFIKTYIKQNNNNSHAPPFGIYGALIILIPSFLIIFTVKDD